ncbi:hypothetical protein ACFORL_11650 [Legionella dresdenensis]|uniref:Dot/Icm T4SS effector n=1 Tax=Legionella dresdenensis TaxID=450200 RepID=A0ABV8CHD2_9GAMM
MSTPQREAYLQAIYTQNVESVKKAAKLGRDSTPPIQDARMPITVHTHFEASTILLACLTKNKNIIIPVIERVIRNNSSLFLDISDIGIPSYRNLLSPRGFFNSPGIGLMLPNGVSEGIYDKLRRVVLIKSYKEICLHTGIKVLVEGCDNPTQLAKDIVQKASLNEIKAMLKKTTAGNNEQRTSAQAHLFAAVNTYRKTSLIWKFLHSLPQFIQNIIQWCSGLEFNPSAENVAQVRPLASMQMLGNPQDSLNEMMLDNTHFPPILTPSQGKQKGNTPLTGITQDEPETRKFGV